MAAALNAQIGFRRSDQSQSSTLGQTANGSSVLRFFSSETFQARDNGSRGTHFAKFLISNFLKGLTYSALAAPLFSSWAQLQRFSGNPFAYTNPAILDLSVHWVIFLFSTENGGVKKVTLEIDYSFDILTMQTPSIPSKKYSKFTPNISTEDSPSRCFDKNGIGTIARQELHSIFEVSSEDNFWHFNTSLTYRILENILKRRRLRDFWTKQMRARASLSTQNSVTSRI